MKMKTVILLAVVFVSGILVGRHPDVRALAQPNSGLSSRTITYNLENCVSTFSDNEVQKTANGWVFWFVRPELSKGLNLKMSNVRPHSAQHGAHSHPAKEIFYILDGKAEFTLNGETTVVGPNTSLYCPSGVSHGIRNVGDKPMRYFVIREN